MAAKLILIFTLFATIISCNNSERNKITSLYGNGKTKQKSLTNKPTDNAGIVEINCDTIYKDPGISIKLIPFDTKKVNEQESRFIFLLSKLQNGLQREIFRDTIESTVQEVKFSDFNNDNIKDILIQNNSDVRSNWTYYLYIVGKNANSIKKIKGFEEIKNPNYIPKYDLIDNMVASGRNWTSFYKIIGDTIKDFNIVIYDGEDENGLYTYDTDYKKAINKILINEKNQQ